MKKIILMLMIALFSTNVGAQPEVRKIKKNKRAYNLTKCWDPTKRKN